MTNEEYKLLEQKVVDLVNLARAEISPNALKGIEHYLEHTELEIAFEILGLEVINKNIDLDQDRKAELLDLAVGLGLEPDSLNDPKFLEKLDAYVSKN